GLASHNHGCTGSRCELRQSARLGARRCLPLRGTGKGQGARQLARQGPGNADARRRLRRLVQGPGRRLQLQHVGWPAHLYGRRPSLPGLSAVRPFYALAICVLTAASTGAETLSGYWCGIGEQNNTDGVKSYWSANLTL